MPTKCGYCRRDSAIPCLPFCFTCGEMFTLKAKLDQVKAELAEKKSGYWNQMIEQYSRTPWVAWG